MYSYIFAFSIQYFPNMIFFFLTEEGSYSLGIQVEFRAHAFISHACLENAPYSGFAQSLVHFPIC